METLTAVAYGVRIGCRTNDAAGLDEMRRRLPFGWRPSRSKLVDRLYTLDLTSPLPGANRHPSHTLHWDADQGTRSSDLDGLLEYFERDVRLYVAETARNRVFVHAGVVGWNGQAIVMPGSSYTGKSTLTAALVRAGALYYSDEYAVIDRYGRVHPFAQPLQLRPSGGYEQEHVAVESLGGRSGKKPLPVGLVLATHYRTGASSRLRRLSQSRGMMELLTHAVSARHSPHEVIVALTKVVEAATVLKGTRGDVADVIPAIERYLCSDGC